MADIFISYAREDRDVAKQMAACFAESGLTIWWDRNISAGTEFAPMIEAELRDAGHVVVIWSAASRGSSWVRDEADFARDHGKCIPLTLDDDPAPMGFRQLQTIRFSRWGGHSDEPAFLELLRSIEGGTSPDFRSPAPVETVRSKVSRPGVAIHEFTCASSSTKLREATEGLTEDIITAFSTIRHFAVDAHSQVDPSQHRYNVEGGIRELGDRVRLNVQLIEVASGLTLWGDKLDTPRSQFEESPDGLVETICGRLFVQTVAAEAERALAMPEAQLGAWELCQRVTHQIPRVWAESLVPEKLEAELVRAVELDPEFGLAHAVLGWSCKSIVVNGMCRPHQVGEYWERSETHLGAARRFSERDLLCDTYIGAAENYAGMHEQAIRSLEKVLARNSAIAEAWCFLAMPNAYLERFDVAREVLDRSEILSPDAGFAMTRDWFRALIELLAGDYEACLPNAELTASVQPGYGYAHAVVALCKSKLGHEKDALVNIRQAKKHNPFLEPEGFGMQLLNQRKAQKGAEEFALIKRLWDAV